MKLDLLLKVVAEIGIVVSETYAAMAACTWYISVFQPIMKLNDLPVAAVSAEQGEKWEQIVP